jgi:hypothetical protein
MRGAQGCSVFVWRVCGEQQTIIVLEVSQGNRSQLFLEAHDNSEVWHKERW